VRDRLQQQSAAGNQPMTAEEQKWDGIAVPPDRAFESPSPIPEAEVVQIAMQIAQRVPPSASDRQFWTPAWEFVSEMQDSVVRLGNAIHAGTQEDESGAFTPEEFSNLHEQFEILYSNQSGLFQLLADHNLLPMTPNERRAVAVLVTPQSAARNLEAEFSSATKVPADTDDDEDNTEDDGSQDSDNFPDESRYISIMKF